MSATTILKGTVKFFLKEKGYGFITDEDGKERFFHISDTIASDLQPEEEVSFSLSEGKRGVKAVDVRRA